MNETSTTGAYVYQQIVKTTEDWAKDKSIIIENVWLFERRPDGKIVTKLSDGLHSYSQLDEYGLSAWDAAQMGGYPGTKEEFYAALGTFEEKVETVLNLVSSLSGKYAETPTLADKPGEDTLTYQSDEVTRTFSIGQQCRVLDAESEDYVFYQLYNITAENKADWRLAGSDGSAFSETVKISLSSNQGVGDPALNGAIVTIKYSGQQTDLIWSGAELSATIPMSVEYEIIAGAIDGYAAPETQTIVAVGGGKRQVGLVYLAEKVTVNVSTNDAADCSGRTVRIVNSENSEVIGTGTGANVVIKVPHGVNYKVSVDNFPGYLLPAEQNFTANTASRSVSFEYQKIVANEIAIDQTVSDPATMISGNVNGDIIQWIRANSHHVLGKKTRDGAVTYCRLKDDDGTKYYDGSNAGLDGTQGDVFLKLPRFFYKGTEGDQVTISFAKEKVDDTYVEWPEGVLIGVYEAYSDGTKIYSRSGIGSSGNVSQANFKQYARARGTGYQLVDWTMHCVLGCLYYAMYGNTNCQAEIGAGTNNYEKNTGQTDSLGMADTKASTNGNTMSINFWGLENWWGNKYEWLDDVVADGPTQKITVYNPETKGTRELASVPYTGYYVKKMKFGKHLDLIPCTNDSKNGSDSTGYCDYQWWPDTNQSYAARVVGRSGGSSSTDGGVAYAGAVYGSSLTYANYGSRLAFRGEVTEASSVAAFKAL